MISTTQVHEYTKGLKVLIVEDDSELLKQMTNVFSNLFKEVDSAKNGELGLKKFETKLDSDGVAYDLVISDINMPVMNGIDMIKKIYNIVPTQPVIITSAHSDAHYLIDLLNIGIDGFLIKPLDMDTINKTLYATAKAISNEYLLKCHINEIEKLNKVLSIKSEQLTITNNELGAKNIALEKSGRIIEKLNHQQPTESKNMSNNINEVLKVPVVKNESEEKTPEVNIYLENIKSAISDLSLKYNRTNKELNLLKNVSCAIDRHIDSISNKDIYSNLKNSLKELSTSVMEHPVYSTDKDLHHIFDRLESFFYIYTKWQKELNNIKDTQPKSFSTSIENEIDKLIKTWSAKV